MSWTLGELARETGAQSFACDASDPASVDALFAAADERLGELFSLWHQRSAEQVAALLPETSTSADARVKVAFLVLLGLCHVEDLASIPAEHDEVSALAEKLLGVIVDH